MEPEPSLKNEWTGAGPRGGLSRTPYTSSPTEAPAPGSVFKDLWMLHSPGSQHWHPSAPGQRAGGSGPRQVRWSIGWPTPHRSPPPPGHLIFPPRNPWPRLSLALKGWVRNRVWGSTQDATGRGLPGRLCPLALLGPLIATASSPSDSQTEGLPRAGGRWEACL